MQLPIHVITACVCDLHRNSTYSGLRNHNIPSNTMEQILCVCLFLSSLSKVNSIIWIYEELTFNCSFLYHQEGDISIGVVLELGCNITHYRERYYRIVPFLMAIDEINRNPNLLPNVTLGFTILNIHCPVEDEQAIRKQRLIQFLPDTGPQYMMKSIVKMENHIQFGLMLLQQYYKVFQVNQLNLHTSLDFRKFLCSPVRKQLVMNFRIKEDIHIYLELYLQTVNK